MILRVTLSCKGVEKLGLVADPVIKAIARLEFEDGLRTRVLLGGCWCHCRVRIKPRVNSNPLLGCRLILEVV